MWMGKEAGGGVGLDSATVRDGDFCKRQSEEVLPND